MSDFAINNSVPFSIKAYEIGEQVGYKVVPGEKEGYERCCSGAESCMLALKDRELVVYDIRRHTGFIVKNVKVNKFRLEYDEERLGWLKTFDNGSTDFEEHEYEYELSDVIKFSEDLLSKRWFPKDFVKGMAESMGKTLEELKEAEFAKEDSIKIKINETKEEEHKESSPEESGALAITTCVLPPMVDPAIASVTKINDNSKEEIKESSPHEADDSLRSKLAGAYVESAEEAYKKNYNLTPEEWNDEMAWQDSSDISSDESDGQFPEPENLDSDINEMFPADAYNKLQTLRTLEQNATRLSVLEDWKSKVQSEIQRKVVSSDITLSSLAILEEWKKKTESDLIAITSRIDVLENGNVAEETVEKIKEEADYERDELAKSRPYVEDMMYLSRFFRVGVRRDNRIELTRPDLCEFSKVSASINDGVGLRVDSYVHEDMHIAEMSGAIVVVISARDNPQFFISMNKEEKELYGQCSETFNEFNRNDFRFHSDAYCKIGHWKVKREQKLAASLPECSECHRSFYELKNKLKIPVQVHHINDDSYARIFKEKLEDLEVLCKECH
ncbi:hypothetical protein LCGC14_1651550, partial [marine sediment metagenome]